MAEIRRPNIVSPTAEGKLNEISTFLYQLVDDLNFLIRPVRTAKSVSVDASSLTPEQIFESIKEMIYTSRELVNIVARDVKSSIGGSYVDKKVFEQSISNIDDKLNDLERAIEEIEVTQSVVDLELSETSENAIANKVVTLALDGKADSEHFHGGGDILVGADEDPPTLEEVILSLQGLIDELYNRQETAESVSFNYIGFDFETVGDALAYLLDRQNN